MKNMTTATAITSNGAAAPAGLSTGANSAQLQATLPGGSPLFSNPLLFNNIFWDNRAGTRTGSAVTGLGNNPLDLSVCTSLPGCDHWDLGVADGTGLLAPTNSIVQQTRPYTASATNSAADPQVVTPYDIAVTFNTWRNNPGFLGAIMISQDLPPNLLGDYHLQSTSSAINRGAASKSGVNAPATDIDNQARPAGGGIDSGADEAAATTSPAACTSQTVNWTQGANSCTASYPGGQSGTSVALSDIIAPATGTVTATCTNGAVALTAPVCSTGTPPPTPGTASITVSLGTLSGTTLNFGSVNGLEQSVLTYTANGGSVVFGNVSVQGGNGNRFSLVGSTCQGATVTAGNSCTVTVRFNGIGNTLRTGALTVTVAGSPTTLTLTGQ
jgi:hypothetical protein